VVQDLGTADIDARLEELLIDGILYAFQEQARAKPYGAAAAATAAAAGAQPGCTTSHARAVPSAPGPAASVVALRQARRGLRGLSRDLMERARFDGVAQQKPVCKRGAGVRLEVRGSGPQARVPARAQVSDDANVMLNGFGTVVNSLKMRAKPYLPQICGTIKWRLNNKSAKIRQQAADLIARIAVVMKVRARPARGARGCGYAGA